MNISLLCVNMLNFVKFILFNSNSLLKIKIPSASSIAESSTKIHKPMSFKVSYFVDEYIFTSAYQSDMHLVRCMHYCL